MFTFHRRSLLLCPNNTPHSPSTPSTVVGLSFFLVFICLWVQTSSLFITSCGLFEIIISYPLGLFVWHVILQEKYSTYLMYNGIFIILGIGADDIFVLSDAFKQSAPQPPHISGSLETRFAGLQPRGLGHARHLRHYLRGLRGLRRFAHLGCK